MYILVSLIMTTKSCFKVVLDPQRTFYNFFHPSSFLRPDLDLAKHTGTLFSFNVTIPDLLVLIHYRRNVYFSKLLIFVFKMRRKSKREDRRPKKRSQAENWQNMTKSTRCQI